VTNTVELNCECVGVLALPHIIIYYDYLVMISLFRFCSDRKSIFSFEYLCLKIYFIRPALVRMHFRSNTHYSSNMREKSLSPDPVVSRFHCDLWYNFFSFSVEGYYLLVFIIIIIIKFARLMLIISFADDIML